ncbi:type II toxin-antitoxin system RelE/ParE family toxin [Candidatus Micrarchaeota archaeon]|nr:type II toxin-antitoxin system RelE/ParE family toxin [Candidatus Micrarchaeota archaeon]
MELVLTNKFFKQLKRIHPSDLKRISLVIGELESGLISGIPLGGKLEGSFKLRVGNYRIIYEISNQKIYLTDVGHRQNIYD